jgi:hypothetical protein
VDATRDDAVGQLCSGKLDNPKMFTGELSDKYGAGYQRGWLQRRSTITDAARGLSVE